MSPGQHPLVACILVNWNGWADTNECLASLLTQDYSSLRIVVVENGSTNDSAPRIREAFPDVSLIETGTNLGFPSGCNVGIRSALAEGGELIWLLNNDTVCPPDTCSKLVAKALANPSAGIVGSVLYYMHDPARVQAWGGGEIDTLLGRTSHAHAPTPLGPRSYLTFASALIPREVFLRVGVLYEGFFMYWDDSDFALRVTRAGYTLSVAEDTAILHKEGGSSAPRSPTIDRYSTAAGLHFIRRYSPLPPLTMTVFLAIKVMSRVLRLRWKNARAVLAAIADYRRQRHNTYSETV